MFGPLELPRNPKRGGNAGCNKYGVPVVGSIEPKKGFEV